MQKKDYYSILGVTRHATIDEVKKAYRKIAIRYHPDKNPGDRWAEEKFKEASNAYKTLSHPEQKRIYDRSQGFHSSRPDLKTSGSRPDSSSINDIFDDFLRTKPQTHSATKKHTTSGPRPSAKQGDNLRKQVVISFAEAALGTQKSVKIQRRERCQKCHGTGARSGLSQAICPKCQGRGSLLQRSLSGGSTHSQICIHCQGTGKVIQYPCRACRRSGWVYKEHALLVKIPAGTKSGKSFRLPGQGECRREGGENGDLFVEMIVEPHPVLKQEGYDLKCQMPIGFAVAALGGEIHIPTLTGEAVLHIPKGTQYNQVFRLVRLGLPKPNRDSGDLYVTVTIEVPTNLTWKQEKLLREYEKSLEPRRK